MAVETTLGERPVAGSVGSETVRRWLWATTVLCYGIGDVASTALGLRMGAREANPLPATLIEVAPGFAATVALLSAWKLLALLAFAAAAYLLPRPLDVAVPVGLSLVGLAVIGWNGAVLLTLWS